MVQVDKEILDIALGLLFRKEFSIDEIPALNRVVEAITPLLTAEVQDEEKPAE